MAYEGTIVAGRFEIERLAGRRRCRRSKAPGQGGSDAIADAARMVHEVAARIRDRASYLEAIPENAAILALAQACA